MTAKIAATMRTIVQNQFTWNNDLKKGVLLNDLSPAILAMSVRVALMILIILIISINCPLKEFVTNLLKMQLIMVIRSLVLLVTLIIKFQLKNERINLK